MRSRASSRRRARRSRASPSVFSAVRETGPRERALAPRRRPRARTSRSVRSPDALRSSTSGGTSSPTTSVGRRVARAPEPVAGRDERVPDLGELERAHEAPPVVRVDGGAPRSGRASASRSMRGVADRRRPRAGSARAARARRAAGRRGRRAPRGGRGPCRPATTATPRGVDELVDLGVRERGERADAHLLVERPDGDEPRRARRLVREDRQAAVDLHRVGRDDLGRRARSASASATALLPDAVGPKIATTSIAAGRRAASAASGASPSSRGRRARSFAGVRFGHVRVGPALGPPASSPRFEPNAETVTRGSRLRAEIVPIAPQRGHGSGGDERRARGPAASSRSRPRSRRRRARRPRPRRRSSRSCCGACGRGAASGPCGSALRRAPPRRARRALAFRRGGAALDDLDEPLHPLALDVLRAPGRASPRPRCPRAASRRT